MNKIVGLTFYGDTEWFNLPPSVLHVLPQGNNVVYLKDKDINDDEVELYLCSVYITGVKEFKEWAKNKPKSKIIVGGYQPSLVPHEFVDYAGKIIIGYCNDLRRTILQNGQIVQGITNFKNLPRYDLFDLNKSSMSICNINQSDKTITINTSHGCFYKCDFCCTPHMSKGIVEKPISYLEKEVNYLLTLTSKSDYCFVLDENILLQKDWEERLTILQPLANKFAIFASASVLSQNAIKKLKTLNVSTIFMGFDNELASSAKNKNFSQAANLCYEEGIFTHISFIIDPIKMLDEEYEKQHYEMLYNKFIEFKATSLYGNFLVPFPGTIIYNQYKDYLNGEMDYNLYDTRNPNLLIKDKKIQDRLINNYNKLIDSYYQNEFYKTHINVIKNSLC